MPESDFKPVNGDVFLRFLDDPDEAGESEESDWGGGELVTALIVDAGPDVPAGIKKGAIAMVYGWSRDCPVLDGGIRVASGYSVAAIVSG